MKWKQIFLALGMALITLFILKACHFIAVDACLDRGGRVAGDMCEIEDGKLIPL